MVENAGPTEPSSRHHSTAIARTLRRTIDQLEAPDPDPARRHHQLVHAQREVIAALIELNAIVGGPAPLPAPGPRLRPGQVARM